MLGLANTHLPYTSIDVNWLGTDYVSGTLGALSALYHATRSSPLAPPQASPPTWAPPGNLLLWESFNKINPVLQWNQPHMVWLADVQASGRSGGRISFAPAFK